MMLLTITTAVATDATFITDCQALLTVLREARVVANDPRSSMARIAALFDAVVLGTLPSQTGSSGCQPISDMGTLARP